MKALAAALVGGLFLALAAPLAAAQPIPVEADAATVDLLFDIIDAVGEGDSSRIDALAAQASDGTRWLPDVVLEAIATRDAEVLVLATQIMAADQEEILDYAAQNIDYELSKLEEVQAGAFSERLELGWADDEGQAVLAIADRRGAELSNNARAALGPLSALGGADAASLSVYEDALDDLDPEAGGLPVLVLVSLAIAVLIFGGLVIASGRRSKALANTDALTGLANRRRLEADIDRRSSSQGTAAVLMIDVDHFKRFNDTHGHALGDEVLRLVGTAMATTFRSSDIPYRYGGEEFCVLLADTTAADARHAGERARQAIADIRLDNGLHVTASVGVALTPPPDLHAAVQRADQALYCAKENGRNRVEIHGEIALPREVAPGAVVTF